MNYNYYFPPIHSHQQQHQYNNTSSHKNENNIATTIASKIKNLVLDPFKYVTSTNTSSNNIDNLDFLYFFWLI
jgi:hypothetical protein